LEAYQTNAKMHYNWGNFLQKQSRYKEAVVQYEKVLELQPDTFGAINNLGSMYEILGRPSVSIHVTNWCVIVVFKTSHQNHEKASCRVYFTKIFQKLVLTVSLLTFSIKGVLNPNFRSLSFELKNRFLK